MLSPNSPQAQRIASLFNWSIVIGSLIFLLVTGLVLYVAWRYRERGDAREPRQLAGNKRLEIAWTIAPTLLLIGLFGWQLDVMRKTDPPPTQQPDVIVTGYSWWWRVEYPKAGIITANEIHIPVGKQILFQLKAGDVIHNFWVPDLGPKKDMIPGKNNNTVWLAADRPGLYKGACAEYCGAQHAWMRIQVYAQPQAEFDAWVRQQQQPPGTLSGGAAPAPQGTATSTDGGANPAEAANNAPVPNMAGGNPARGQQIFRRLTCVSCHAISGISNAQAGPNLTHLASRQTLGTGILQNTPENLARWIRDPQAIKPGVQMPGYNLPDTDLRDLVAYLGSLK